MFFSNGETDSNDFNWKSIVLRSYMSFVVEGEPFDIIHVDSVDHCSSAVIRAVFSIHRSDLSLLLQAGPVAI